MKKRIAVVCPGRGSYTRETLGYFKKYGAHGGRFLENLDRLREKEGEPSLTTLDSEKTFKTRLHTKGEHASTLIYACSALDFMSIPQDQYEIVAVTGNSMGWYIAMALAGVLDPNGAYQVIQTMGSMMREELIGGQIIYPVIDENWHRDSAKEVLVEEHLNKARDISGAEVYTSIHLGGYVVIGGNKVGLQYLLEHLPKEDPYPFQLINHGAFHTPLLKEVSTKAFDLLREDLFSPPKINLIDGRGHLWRPYSTDVEDIYRYTFKEQVLDPYDFTTAITVTLKEFCPDHLVLLGPGNSLGGAIGQTLIQNKWHNIHSKDDFIQRQKENPFLISMGVEEQRVMLKPHH